MVYNRAYGVLACVAGRFPLKGNYTTKISLCKSTVYEEMQKQATRKTGRFFVFLTQVLTLALGMQCVWLASHCASLRDDDRIELGDVRLLCGQRGALSTAVFLPKG